MIDEDLPGTQIRLKPDWALQDPQDYVRRIQNTIPAVLQQSGVDPADVIGIGIDFTACTMLPAKADGTPLCDLPEYRSQSPCLGKAVETPRRPTRSRSRSMRLPAIEMKTGWTAYGGKISSEWFFSKALQIVNEAPEIYQAADRLIEAADWVVWQLTGKETRNSCTAGYKAIWSKREGFPSNRLFCCPPSDTRKCGRRENVHRYHSRRAKSRRVTRTAANGPGLNPVQRWR